MDLSAQGFDWLLIDTQHGPMDRQNLGVMLNAVHSGAVFVYFSQLVPGTFSSLADTLGLIRLFFLAYIPGGCKAFVRVGINDRDGIQ